MLSLKNINISGVFAHISPMDKLTVSKLSNKVQYAYTIPATVTYSHKQTICLLQYFLSFAGIDKWIMCVIKVNKVCYRDGVGALEFGRGSSDALRGWCGAAWLLHIQMVMAEVSCGLLGSRAKFFHLLSSFSLIYRRHFSCTDVRLIPSFPFTHVEA